MNPGDIIRKHCLPEEPLNEAVQKIAETFSDNFTFEDALDIIAVAADEAKGHEDDTKDWALIDRVAWVVRRAYITGAAYATSIMFEHIEASAEAANNVA